MTFDTRLELGEKIRLALGLQQRHQIPPDQAKIELPALSLRDGGTCQDHACAHGKSEGGTQDRPGAKPQREHLTC